MVVELDAAVDFDRRHVTPHAVGLRRDGARMAFGPAMAGEAALDVVLQVTRNRLVRIVAVGAPQPVFAVRKTSRLQ
jgi:hypothetical protein